MFRRKTSPEKIINRKIGFARLMQQIPDVFRLLPVSINTWWENWTDTILISLIWVISLILFPLNPPATFGLYYALQNPKDTGERPRMMWEGFKKYAGVSYLNTLITLFVIAVSYVNWIFYTSMENQWVRVLSGLSVTLLFIWGMLQFYLIPIILQQEEKKLLLAYRNAFSVFIASPLFAMGAVIFYLLVAAVSYLFLPFMFFGSPVVLVMLNFYTVHNRLVKFNAIKPDSATYQYDPIAVAQEFLAVLEEPGKIEEE